MSRKIEVQILGDPKDLERALGRAQQKTNKFGSAVSAGAKVGAIALGGLGIAAKIGFDELKQGQKVAAQTAAVLKSTGHEANVSAKHVRSYAQAMMLKTGIDDEAIASSENLLLTFKNIRNEAGKGNKIFDQARTATLNLSVAMHKDLNSSAILVGKALNDPVKGMTALRRVGVTLSDGQQKLVKHLVETGHKMKAQKIILRELRTEFGGSAVAAGKTLGGQLDILKESFKNVAASLVRALLPAAMTLVGTLKTVVGWMGKNQGTTRKVVVAVAGLSAGIIVLNGVMKVWKAVTAAFIPIQWSLNAAMEGNPIGLVVIAVAALAVGLVIAYKKSETFRNVVNTSFNKVKQVAGSVIDFIKGHWRTMLTIITGGFYPIVQGIINHWHAIQSAVSGVLGFIQNHWRTMLTILTGGLFPVVAAIIRHWDSIKSAAGRVVTFIINRWGDIRGPLSSFAGWVDKYVIGPIRSIIRWVKRAIGWLSKLNPFGGSGQSTTSGNESAQNYASSRLGAYGMGQNNMPALISLWNGESGWNPRAYNSSSGAQGIPQMLPSAHPGAHPGFPSWPPINQNAQIDWGLGYIKGAYGSAINAYSKWLSRSPHWYASGGTVPGPTGSPRLAVVHGGEQYLGARYKRQGYTGVPRDVFAGGARGNLRPGSGRFGGPFTLPRHTGGGHIQINLVLDGRVLGRAMVDVDKLYRRQNAGRALLRG